MSALLLLILAVTSTYLPQLPLDLPEGKQAIVADIKFMGELAPFLNAAQSTVQSINEFNLMLHNEAPTLNQSVIHKALMTLKCATEYNVDHNNILTLIDYSLPSNEKRLWVFDLQEKKLLFHTYVSHGIKSGALQTNFFSNKYNSKASSIGVYQTQKSYYGRDGLSLRLEGLDRSFNDNASNRAVVIHSGWYVEEGFIKKYGRPGRSWGCPALPLANSQDIINTIKDKSLLVIYYPNDNWFTKSKFLNCDRSLVANKGSAEVPVIAPDDQRDDILFVGGGYKSNKGDDSKPVAVVSAEIYQRIFHTTAPLTRMLRRQINNAEYIALSTAEFNYLANQHDAQDAGLNVVAFVVPVIKQVRGGYYETQMQIVNLGKIKEAKAHANALENALGNGFTVYFEGKPSINLNASNQFIRWVGL